MSRGQLQAIDATAEWLLEARGAAAAFTGAGVSTASGIPSFRGAGGVWSKYPPDQFATPLGLAQSFVVRFPRLRSFILESARSFLGARPGPPHVALAALERAGLLGAVVTQNVDGLHEVAGSGNVIQLHGSFFRSRCRRCGTRQVPRQDIERFIGQMEAHGASRLSFLRAYRENGIRCSNCGGRTRPDMVLFGEQVAGDAYERAALAAERARLLLVMGTSVLVRPASDIPYIALHAGAKIVEVNQGETELTPLADVRFAGDADLFARLLLERLQLSVPPPSGG